EPLPRPELLFSCAAKRKVTQREGRPGWRLPSIHGRQVRETGSGFSSGHPARAKRRAHPWTRPLRGLVVPASPPPRGPGKAARILRALLEKPDQKHSARSFLVTFSRARERKRLGRRQAPETASSLAQAHPAPSCPRAILRWRLHHTHLVRRRRQTQLAGVDALFHRAQQRGLRGPHVGT